MPLFFLLHKVVIYPSLLCFCLFLGVPFCESLPMQTTDVMRVNQYDCVYICDKHDSTHINRQARFMCSRSGNAFVIGKSWGGEGLNP